MENTTYWTAKLKEKRLAFGISQNKLAVASGITRQYLSDIENGKTIPTEQVQTALFDSLERFNPENPLEMLFDYVRIRFPTADVARILGEVLHLNIDYMIHEDFGYYSYPEHYRFGDIMVMVSPELSKGVLLELKGKGCRQFENFLLAQHRSWYGFFADCLEVKGVFKRLDLAINDKVGILDIPELARKCKQEECISVFRSFKNYRSGELVHREEKPDMGNTLYIGSLKSEVYFCIYEKDYEQFVKNDIPLEDAEVKNRFEIRLKNDRAIHAINDLLTHKNAEKTAFEIINRYLRFADKDITKRRSQWRTNERWEWFMGKNRGALRLTTKPEPYSYERTLNWLRHQVAPTLKVASILDILNDTEVIPAMIREAHLTDKHEKLIEQQNVAIEGNDCMSSLTYELEKLGFLCGIEKEIYIQDTGKYTSLIIEGECKGGGNSYRYDFYKQTFYPRYPNKITVYGEDMTDFMLLDRVERYIINRKRYLTERSNKNNIQK